MADPRAIYSDRGRGDDQWQWRKRNNDWDRSDRRRWHRDRDDDDDVAAGIIGFAAGTIAGAALAGSSNSHVARCEARYQSYDVRTDSYLGYDGYWHRCPL